MAERNIITFYLGDILFGIDILLTREINCNVEITPVALAPEFVRGLMNLRGQVVTVVDLAVRLGLGRQPLGATSACLVLKTLAEIKKSGLQAATNDATLPDLVGILVDRIGDVVAVDEVDIEPPPAHVGGVERRFLAGVVKLADSLLVTLRVSALLTDEAPGLQGNLAALGPAAALGRAALPPASGSGTRELAYGT